ncbi:MAG: YggT family protein [Desulfovibrionaceae bacterium]|nr:YggT family protein [Desulfovibrionaceae bacterium]
MILFANALSAVAFLAGIALKLYFWVVLASALMSWIHPDPYNPVVRVIRQLTEPVFYRVRKALPFTYTSGIDFSPVVVLFAIELADRVIVSSLAQYAMTMH